MRWTFDISFSLPSYEKIKYISKKHISLEVKSLILNKFPPTSFPQNNC